ncbi:DNA polymerase III subunit delta [Cellulosilyticum sp. I15G10I2]|uniref:DNA polymerase III subunit delta n=1 Tax=Cellulosilyticum sp. I15G10I2 TaxID=1892843 RepID=UPI00085C0D08|nr:DNA polymerase III subunit delta [Cellulosilyticum sp. I15G10I2]
MQTKQLDQCYLLIGEDAWSKNQFIIELKNKVLTSGYEMMNYYEAKDKEIVVSKLIEIAETLPFFAERKMIYIKESGFFKTGKKEETEKFESFMQSMPDYLTLIIDEKEIDKRSKLYKTIKAKYTVCVFDYPGEEYVLKILEEKIKHYKVRIDKQTLLFFLRNMPEDIAYIIGEFDKLIAYADDKPINKQMIEEVCVFSLEKRIFELVKRIAHRNAQDAFKIYHTLIQSKESPIGILVLIARQYRIMLQIKYLLKNNMAPKEIASRMKLPYFALKEIIEQVNLYSFKQLEEILGRCLETDKDIKNGRMNSVGRVEVLMIECLNA